ncbi:lysosomal acid lipase/cholesteryl ester hydrolase-like [Haliotis rufescens]|uniref:lysosomal acid lipase/cholesteryl ester hydrolase-like n=1 Tax=Haliotis rufescens TaxID=6454 RepID=UPI00201E81F1|nr:lysosomal acid lipase/cholesteryl ester hydrolase-like [Haliotis rufescens]
MSIVLIVSVYLIPLLGWTMSTRTQAEVPGLTTDPEIYMNTTELITSKGFPCENHYVTTEDGFILNMQRIPHGRGENHTGAVSAKPTVLLQHGLLGSSNNFVLNPANESLAFILADAGADVWLGNVRGNTYSRAHKTLKPSDKKFWEWSFDEMAKYDLPAMIDYIVQTTGQPQVHYVGHSQGTLIGFAGFSQNKTLGQLVKTFIALAPVATVGHIKSPLRLLAPFSKGLKLFDLFGHGEFEPSSNLTKWLAKDVCKGLPLLCEDFFFVISGFDYATVNKTRVPVYVAHTPSGTSVQNMIHFGQEVNGDQFVMYDFGSASANMAHYGQATPPAYRPDEMDVPVVLFSGGKDFLADPDDVTWIRSQLKNIVGDHMIPHWEHLDFILALDAPSLCYNEIKRLVFS